MKGDNGDTGEKGTKGELGGKGDTVTYYDTNFPMRVLTFEGSICSSICVLMYNTGRCG